MQNISTQDPKTMPIKNQQIQTIDDIFPFEEATKNQLLNDLGKTPKQIICPYMQAIHLKKEFSTYSVYGTCKCDSQECRYNPANYSPRKCQISQSSQIPDPTTDIRYAMFCVGK